MERNQVLKKMTKVCGNCTKSTIDVYVRNLSRLAKFAGKNGVPKDSKWLASKDTALVGFRKMVHRGVTEMDSCEILHPSVGRRLAKLRMLLSSLNCRADIPQMEVAIGDDHACIVIRHLSPLENIDKKRLK